MRDVIIKEIQRIAAESGGQAPGQTLFARKTGIPQHHWRGKFWARWGDALSEAGFKPNDWVGKSDANALLSGYISACRHYRHLPTYSELDILRQTDPSIPVPNAIKRHFGLRDQFLAAVSRYIAGNDSFADIARMLPNPDANVRPKAQTQKVVEGFVYLIKSGDFYKVGRSDNAERRFKQISVSLPHKAELFHTIRTDDPIGIEAYWHRRFADRRANGEWFRLNTHDIVAFKKRKFQ